MRIRVYLIVAFTLFIGQDNCVIFIFHNAIVIIAPQCESEGGATNWRTELRTLYRIFGQSHHLYGCPLRLFSSSICAVVLDNNFRIRRFNVRFRNAKCDIKIAFSSAGIHSAMNIQMAPRGSEEWRGGGRATKDCIWRLLKFT